MTTRPDQPRTSCAGLRVLALLAVLSTAASTACSKETPSAAARTPAGRSTSSLSPIFSDGFESGLGSWTATTTSGLCTWHVLTNPENISVSSELNPVAVTLPDSGAHLPAAAGTNVVWFGEDSTGTYIGSDYPRPVEPKNGGTSNGNQAGTLLSPPISLEGIAKAVVEFDSWWEIEGVAGQSFDIMDVLVTTDDGATFTSLGKLNPTFATNQPGYAGFTAGGPSTAPEWRHYAYDVSDYSGQTIRLQFSFNTNDPLFNAFRGWTFDNVSVNGGASLPPPVITQLSSASGVEGDIITLSGGNFIQGAQFFLGVTQIPQGNITQFGTNFLIFMAPLLDPGPYDVTVVNPDGQTFTLPAGFTYASSPSPAVTEVSPNSAQIGVAQSVTITGSDFADGASVSVGAAPATDVVVASPTQIVATFPGLGAGTYNVTVSNPSGQSGTLFSAYGVTDSSTVTVTAPNGGESWAPGTTQDLTWTSSGATVVSIDLYDSGSFVSNVAASISAATGTYAWAIPSELAESSGYTIKIFNPDGTSSDFSDAAFTIGSAPVLITTATAVSGSVSSSVHGQSVTFTATVSPSSATGSVQFRVDSVDFGTPVALSGGSATSPATSSLSTGSHAVEAVYSGGGAYTASTGSLTYDVGAAATTTTVSSAANPSASGESVTFTATVGAVAPGSGTPTGSVELFAGATSLGTATLAGGTAAISTAALAVGSHDVTAVYAGSSDFSGSSNASDALGQVVVKASTAVAVTPSSPTTVFGEPVTLTAAVSVVAPGAGLPTGTVTFLDGATLLGTASLDATGLAQLTTSALSVGGHSLTASYGGDASRATSSGNAAVGVSKASTAVALSTSPASSVFGQSVTLTAAVSVSAPGAGSPSGTVTFLDGATVLGTASLGAAGATLTVSSLAVSAHSLQASYGGDGSFSSAVSTASSHTVAKATTALALSSSPASPAFGQAVTLTATVSVTAPGAGTASGTVTFADGSTVLDTVPLAGGVATLTVSNLPVGSHSIDAAYSGAVSFNGSSHGATVSVGQGASSTAVSASTSSSTYGQAVTFSATVAAVAPATGTPTGSLTFLEGAASLGTGTLDSSGHASLTVSSLAAGSHAISVQYGGDSGFSASTAAASAAVSVAKAAASIAISFSPTTSVSGEPVACTVTVTSPGGIAPGQVTLTDGGAPLGAVTLDSSGVATFTVHLLAGTHPLAVTYAGDTNFLAAPDATASYVVGAASSAVAVNASPAATRVNRPVTFQAHVSAGAPGSGTPGGTVTFKDGATILGTATLDGSGNAALAVPSLAHGNHSVTVEYGGSTEFQPSTGSVTGGVDVQKSAPVAGSGTAISLDGASQAGVVTDAGGSLDGARTVEIWFAADSSASGSPACLVQHGSAGALRFGLCLTAARDGLEVRRGDGSGHAVPLVIGAGWHHVALVDDATQTTLYFDGSPVAALDGGFPVAIPGEPLVIGAAASSGGHTDRFTGHLDELRLWSTARSAQDVQADRMRPIAGDAQGLLAIWRMDEGEGTEMYDAAPGHLVASLEGASAWTPSDAWKRRQAKQERALTPFVGGYDPDGLPVTATVVSAAAGTVVASGDSLSYSPPAGFLGVDSFTYSVTSAGQSSSFTTEVDVSHVDLCQAQSDCAGGDVCTNQRCVGPATLRAASGGCQSTPGGGSPTSLLPFVLAGLLALRRRRTAARIPMTATAGRLGRACLLAVLGLLVAPAARASGFALDTYQPAAAGDRFFTVPDATVDGHLLPRLRLEGGWAHAPLTIYSGGTAVPNGQVVQDQLGLRAGAALPLWDAVLIEADLAMSAWQTGQTPFSNQSAIAASAFSDPRLGVRVAILRSERLSLAAGLSVWVPFGSSSDMGSDGAFRALPHALASGRVGRFAYAAEAGVELRKRMEVQLARTGPGLRLGVAGGWLFLHDTLQIGPELYSNVRFSNAGESSLEALLGARLQRGAITFGAGIGGHLVTDAPGAAPLRIVGQISFSGLDLRSSRTGERLAVAPVPEPAPAPAPEVPAAPPAPEPLPVRVVVAAPPPAEPPAPPQPKTVASLQGVRFVKNAADLLPASTSALSAAAEKLEQHPEIDTMLVLGYSDDRGSPRHNQGLTARRASAVRTWLVQHGIQPKRLVAQGCGSRNPVASNATEAGRAKNRRVELVVRREGTSLPGCAP